MSDEVTNDIEIRELAEDVLDDLDIFEVREFIRENGKKEQILKLEKLEEEK